MSDINCIFHLTCHGSMVCGICRSMDCECEEIVFTSCNQCMHKKCHWCGNTTNVIASDQECQECCDWDYVGDVCESDFCIHYLGGQGNITIDLVCNQCQSKTPIIRVPLAFPLHLNQLLKDYPDFSNISNSFLKYYSYCHTNGIWECFPNTEFRLAQEYFNFDAGIIVLGRSRDDENKAKHNDALKIEKEMRKKLKKERRLLRLAQKNDRVNQILLI